MTYYVTVTRQGQISIPAPIRRMFGLDKVRQATVDVEANAIVIKPLSDILEFEGIFKTKKRLTPREERQAFEEALARGEV